MAEYSAARRGEKREGYFKRYGEAITYRRISNSSGHPNLKTGDLGEVATDSAIAEACLSDVTQRQIKGSGGQLKAGDKWFRLRVSDLPENPPKTTSRIVYGGTVYSVIDHVLSADGYAMDIAGRRV